MNEPQQSSDPGPAVWAPQTSALQESNPQCETLVYTKEPNSLKKKFFAWFFVKRAWNFIFIHIPFPFSFSFPSPRKGKHHPFLPQPSSPFPFSFFLFSFFLSSFPFPLPWPWPSVSFWSRPALALGETSTPLRTAILWPRSCSLSRPALVEAAWIQLIWKLYALSRYNKSSHD